MTFNGRVKNMKWELKVSHIEKYPLPANDPKKPVMQNDDFDESDCKGLLVAVDRNLSYAE